MIDFNYPIRNRDKGPGIDFDIRDVPYEEYLKAFSAVADEILLNIRRFERKVVEGQMPKSEYKEIV